MNRAAIEMLYGQQARLIGAKDNLQGRLTTLNEKISRLRTAATELSTQITTLKGHQQRVDSLTVDEGQWKGEHKQKFDDRYNAYKESVKNFVAKTEGIKEQVDEVIARAESLQGMYLSELSTISSQITSISNQIERERRK